jgi:hypothetical protein
MVNALTSWQFKTGLANLCMHQTLHGYAEGHRLLESSLPIPDDLKRVMLRMSDLSGSGATSGFQEYLTGYPLSSLDAYALAKTWYASEMPRPGCVWTHTFVIPAPALAQISSLSTICRLFRRPSETSGTDYYSKPIALDSFLTACAPRSDLNRMAEMQTFLAAHYQSEWHALIFPARNSEEFADLIFDAWSQKWPSLRMSFTFCTGSLSARTFEKRLLDVQCVPLAATRQVLRESSEISSTEPVLVNFAPHDFPAWAVLAATDAFQLEGGPVRSFLWSVTDNESNRADFASFLKVYEELSKELPLSGVISLIAELFPRASDARHLKKVILGDGRELPISRPNLKDSKEKLIALATTEHFQSFDAEQLELKKQASRILNEEPSNAFILLGELFRAQLNPIGDEILSSLIQSLGPEDGLIFAKSHPQFIPALVRINPELARSEQLWLAARDRRRELFESLGAQQSNLSPELVRGIVDALLNSHSDAFVRQAFDRWGKTAVFQALDWSEAHDGSMSETCSAALTFKIPEVMSWINEGPTRSIVTLAAVARVVAPYSYNVTQSDSTIWLQTARGLRESGRYEDALYVCTFLLALALGNAPPSPLVLISESFETVHEAAARNELKDDGWIILEPLVPELSWGKNWDRCERVRRALVLAFVRHGWPAWEIKERINNPELLRQLLRSARKADVESYFTNI